MSITNTEDHQTYNNRRTTKEEMLVEKGAEKAGVDGRWIWRERRGGSKKRQREKGDKKGGGGKKVEY